jgi:hypothetical protein
MVTDLAKIKRQTTSATDPGPLDQAQAAQPEQGLGSHRR